MESFASRMFLGMIWSDPYIWHYMFLFATTAVNLKIKEAFNES